MIIIFITSNGEIMKIKSIFLASMILLAYGCSDKVGAKEDLEGMGYIGVITHGFSFFGCDFKDYIRTKFTAKSPSGRRITGVVCRGNHAITTVMFDR